MWTAGLSITGTLLSLYAAGASAQNGVACNPRTLGEDGNSGLETSVKNLAMKLCDTHLKDEEHAPFIHDKGPEGVVLTITHADENSDHAAAENCATHFNEIVEQCIVKAGVWGGTVQVDGLLYEIYQDNTISSRDEEVEIESRGLEARAKKSKTKAKKTAKTTTKKKGTKATTTKGKKATKTKGKKTKASTTPEADSCAYVPGSKGKTTSSKGKKLSARAGCSVPEDSWMKMELNGLADTSDLISTNPCKAVKRSLEGLEFSTLFHKRMSGHGKEMNWEQWEEVLKELDTEFGTVLGTSAGKEKLTIIWAGGISGVHYGSRGKKGATGDVDFLYHTDTSDALRQKFKQAIEAVVKKNPTKLSSKPLSISNSLETSASAARLKKWSDLSDKSKEPVAFKGTHFQALDGDWLFQLFGKMSRMYQMRLKRSSQDIKQKKLYGQHKDRDEKDAKFFFKKWSAANSGDLTLKDFLALEGPFGKDQAYIEAMIGSTIKLVAGSGLSGVDSKITALSKAAGC